MHYSDLRSFKPEITLICGDLRFSGRPAVYSQFVPLPIRPSSWLSSVTGQTFGGYLLVPGNKLNKQQLTTAKFP